MSPEAQVFAPLATNCDFGPVVDKRHSAVHQDTWLLSAYIGQLQLGAHAAEMPHYVAIAGCQESDQTYG
jgi:hypothetical protein